MTQVTYPAAMMGFYNRLEIIGLEFPFLCLYGEAAAEHASDPLERIKYLVAGFVLHPLTIGRKFNGSYTHPKGLSTYTSPEG